MAYFKLVYGTHRKVKSTPNLLLKSILEMKYEKNEIMLEPANISWAFDSVHCSIRFVARHLLLSEIDGVFLSFAGKVTSDDDAFSNPVIALEIDATSIKTNSDIRDNNLRSDNFFNTALYPKISFQSLSIQRVLGSHYKLVGQLTIRDVTNTIELDVQRYGLIKDPDGRTKAGFQIRGCLNRFDYNIKFNRIVNGVIDVGSEISIICNIELFKLEREL